MNWDFKYKFSVIYWFVVYIWRYNCSCPNTLSSPRAFCLVSSVAAASEPLAVIPVNIPSLHHSSTCSCWFDMNLYWDQTLVYSVHFFPLCCLTCAFNVASDNIQICLLTAISLHSSSSYMCICCRFATAYGRCDHSKHNYFNGRQWNKDWYNQTVPQSNQ